jgi:gamma-butyrobetaine dioxygenase
MTLCDELEALFSLRGTAAYFGEPVSVAEHGLQAAYFATRARASEPLVIAALLHDIGHLIEPAPDEIADWRQDAHHELSGSRWLARYFGPEVWEPVRLHVPAKRYLCATDPTYFRQLSAASVHTLELQGGAMNAAERAAFAAERHAEDAILLRRCDDAGKVPELRAPGFVQYQPLIERLARSTGSG